MAKPVSEEELQLKKRARRRLIGAIALVAGVAAVLPMVLDSEPKPRPGSQEINIQIPSQDAKLAPGGKSVPAPAKAAKAVDKSDAKAPETIAPEAKAVEAKVPEVKATEVAAPSQAKVDRPTSKPPDNPNDSVLFPNARVPAEKTVVKLPEKQADKAITKAPEKTAERVPEKPADKAVEKAAALKAGPGAYFIQVIALSDNDKAQQVRRQVSDAGVRAYTEVVTAGAGKVTRVRAGPFATREEAENARGRLQGIGLEGKVAAY